MEIIREGPSASRPPVLDALVAGYDPPMTTVNGVSVPKPEVDWTDAEEQASVGNARALNAIFNDTFKVKISKVQLITSKFEALRMTEDESVSDYNKRVLRIVNESLLLSEKITDSKIVQKVLRSLPRKFHMKVTTIEEAHDITMLKLDELFGSLLTFEMATADRESKKGKGIDFKSTHLSGEVDTNNESGCSEESKNDKLSIEKLEALWKEDCEARAMQKERIQDLIKENERLISVISSLKLKLREVQNENDKILKSVKMLNSGTKNLDSILNSGHNGSHRYCLGFVASTSSLKATSEIKFVPASKVVEHETTHTGTSNRTTVKSLGRTCYYCGRNSHIRSICYKLRQDQLHQQKYWNRSHAQPRMVWRIKSAERYKIAFTSI
ncbi:gag-pol polyprotein [Cucumis melo var. makuwa]|uniref:Gag-pol polyprotein n=1 Tax=Cucumis melo var. makuwa TaxID=1194695 RepID=A0A5D3D6L1_CUCMM|nr:gag-pol polyprotein [Cucumis melo var. makuwa]